ncbi:MAG: FtsX-like permease family protein [Candidatus Lokiarchaeota archaeon]|nr:FtsX-like permease family protein [Candidatus Lokiarchaeota archaeon]
MKNSLGTSNRVLEIKIAFRSLLKRPIRSIFTILSVVLGVSIFFAVNIAMDSIEQSIIVHLDEELFGYVNQWIYLLKGVFTMLSTMSLFICVIIIKNLMEMTKEDQLYELGLLRTVGCSKRGIFMVFFYQVMIISVVGMILGLLTGYLMSFLLLDPFKEMLSSFASITTEYEIQLHISVQTVIIGTLAGLLVPLIFGTIPAIAAGRSQIIATLNSKVNDKSKISKSLKFIAFQVILSLILIGLGIYLILFSFNSLLSFQINPTNEANIAVIFILISSLIFILGCTTLGALILPYLTLALSYIFKPLIGKMRVISYRNLIRNSRRTKNTFLMITISISFLIAVNIAIHSIKAGIVPGARMRFGGDIILSNGNWTHHQSTIPIDTAELIAEIDDVEEVCAYKNSLSWNGFTMCDGFGINYQKERFGLLVINTSSYTKMHSSSIYSYQDSKNFFDFIHQLDDIGSVILQDGLLETIGKKKGDLINVTTAYTNDIFPTISSNLEVVGVFNILPAVWSSWYQYEIEHYTAIISWKTYFALTGSNYSTSTGNFWVQCDDPYNADIVKNDIKNLYQALGPPWNSPYIDFRNPWIVTTISEDISITREIVNVVLIIIISILLMALVVSMLGFLISMEMSVNKRRSELGILRSIGFSKKQIIRMIFGETAIITIASLIAGILIGLITGFLISRVPFLAYLPLIFTINWIDIALLTIITAFLGIVASIIPAFKTTKLNVMESINKRRV